MLRALLRKNKLREQTSVSQAALKILQAHREVVALYYWPPCGISKSGRGEIDLLKDGEAVRLKRGAHRLGLTMKLDASSSAQGNGNTGVPTVPCSISLHEKRPPGFSTRATSRASPSLSAMFIVTAYDQT